MKKVTSTQNRSFFVIYLLDSANLSCATIDICLRVRAWGISNKCMTPVISVLVLTGGLVWLRTYPKLGTNWLKLRNGSTSFWVRNGRGYETSGMRTFPFLTFSRFSPRRKFYSRNNCQDPRRIFPAEGELCVARYSKDDKWYRARITGVREDELQVK